MNDNDEPPRCPHCNAILLIIRRDWTTTILCDCSSEYPPPWEDY